MKRSLAQLVALAIVVAALAAPSAMAAAHPPFTVSAIHGNFAYGIDPLSNGPARFDLRNGIKRVYALPPVATKFTSLAPVSDSSLVGVATNTINPNYSQWLYRYDLKSGRYELLASLPNGAAGFCADDFKPLSVANDGTVVALTRAINYPGAFPCVKNPTPTTLWRYRPGHAPEEVWLPNEFRSQLDSSQIASNGDTVALATPSTTITPSQLVTIDTGKRKILSQRSAGEVDGLWLINPHSLFIAEDTRGPLGRLSFADFRKRVKERTIFTGGFNYTQTTNCGSRIVVTTERRLRLINAHGKVLLRRMITETDDGELAFSGVVCGKNYLQYGQSGFVRQIVNISKLK